MKYFYANGKEMMDGDIFVYSSNPLLITELYYMKFVDGAPWFYSVLLSALTSIKSTFEPLDNNTYIERHIQLLMRATNWKPLHNILVNKAVGKLEESIEPLPIWALNTWTAPVKTKKHENK